MFMVKVNAIMENVHIFNPVNRVRQVRGLTDKCILRTHRFSFKDGM